MGRALEKIEREPHILFFFFWGERKVSNFIDELNPIEIHQGMNKLVTPSLHAENQSYVKWSIVYQMTKQSEIFPLVIYGLNNPKAIPFKHNLEEA